VEKRPTSHWLLTRLFLRQFLENDLLSPDGDRSQMLAVTGATVISLTLFISMFMSSQYAMTILMPAHAAVLTLNDKFFYVALAMLVTAITAAAQWDALALDQRDAAILQPLPVRPRTLRLAKITAVALLGGAVAVAVNVFPTWVFPWMVAFAVPQMSAAQLFTMMGVHAAITIPAAVFGFLAVIGLRETAAVVLGPKWFTRVSPVLQTVTLVALGIALLLLPLSSSRIGTRGLSGWRVELPPTAFVGAYEVATGGFLAELPRRPMTAAQAKRDQAFAEIYEERRPLFPPLARRAQLLLVAAIGLVGVATLINARRLPAAAVVAPGRRRRSRLIDLGGWLFPRNGSARAGFAFAVATIFRNKTHRLTLAAAAAIGCAAIVLTISRVDLAEHTVSVRLLAVQPLLYGCLLAAFRHVIRVPAELRANWAIQLAWRGRVRSFASGAQLAALLTLAVPAILVAATVVAIVAGVQAAVAHALLGLLGAAIMLEALMLMYDGVPFACSYLPGDNMRAMAPIYGAAFLIGAMMFARLEYAIVTGVFTWPGLAGLVLLLISLRVASSRRRRVAQVDFDETPVTLQQLGLHT
jgi:hypothetical protein